MIKIDFPVKNIKFGFNIVGQSFLMCTWNGEPVLNGEITEDKIKDENILSISFAKINPADEESFATLQYFLVNGGSFKNQIETQQITVDKNKHSDAPESIQFDGYFGYISRLDVKIMQDSSLLKQAAWIIADNEFEYTKWPFNGNKHRTKTFENICRDAKFMYTGCTPPHNKKISDIVNDTKVSDLLFVGKNDKEKIEKWIADSDRVTLKGLESFDNFTMSTGVSDSLYSFVQNSRVIQMPSKMYYMHGELFADTELIRLDPFERPIALNANVLLEYPSPWYTNTELDKIIELAKDKNAKIALDLTWLPVSNKEIHLDLDGIDQIFFSMNKTWPIDDLRPAYRWSRNKINDRQTFDYEMGMYEKVSANMFTKLIDHISLDYVYNDNKTKVEDIHKTFNLVPTPVLWFAQHDSAVHDTKGHISKHYYLDEFVCVEQLLNYKGKYFW